MFLIKAPAGHPPVVLHYRAVVVGSALVESGDFVEVVLHVCR